MIRLLPSFYVTRAAAAASTAADDAISMRSLLGQRPGLSPGAYRALATATYCAIVFLQGMTVNIVGPAGPSLAAAYRTDLKHVGHIMSAEGLGGVLSSGLLAALLERAGGHSVLRAACAFVLAGMALVPRCESLSYVVAIYFVLGCALLFIGGTCSVLVTHVHAGRDAGPWVNLINASFGLGSSAAPLLFVAMHHRAGDGLLSFWAIAAFAVIPTVAISMLKSPPKPEVSAGVEVDHTSDSAEVAGFNLGSRAAYVRWTVVLPLMFVMVLGVGGEIAYSTWIYSFATTGAGMQPTEAALVNSAYWTSFTLGRLGSIPLAALLLPEMILLPAAALQLLSALLVLVRPGATWALWAGTIGYGAGVSSVYANILSLLASYGLLTPSSVGNMQLACFLGHMTIPNSVGFLMHHSALGNESLFAAVGAIAAVSFAVIFAVNRHLRKNFHPARGSLREARQLADHYKV